MRSSHMFFGKRPVFTGVRIAGMVVFGILAAAVFGLVFGYLVMILWNWLMPAVFGITTITYWQAFGIVILAKLIFGAIGRGKGHDHDHDRDHDFYREKFFNAFRKEGGEEDGSGFERYRHYHDFWNEEGRDAFDRYLRRNQGAEPGKPAHDGADRPEE